jgi:hypothetical protein
MNDLVIILNVDNGLNDLFVSEHSVGAVLRSIWPCRTLLLFDVLFYLIITY